MAASSANQPQVDTAKCPDRRTLRFSSIDEVLADVDRLASAERAGTLHCAGNWTLGQTLGHLAAWVNFAFDGFPMRPPPLPIRLILKFRKNRFIHDTMPAGVKIPGIEGGTVAREELSLDEGLQRYRTALERLRRNVPGNPSPIFGRLTHDEWIALNLRHAELHLSFMVPEPH